MGENITTRGVDLLNLKRGTRLYLGEEAVVEVTGLRNPCYQLDGIQDGLMKATLEELPDGKLLRKTGVMGIVLQGRHREGEDAIRVECPEGRGGVRACLGAPLKTQRRKGDEFPGERTGACGGGCHGGGTPGAGSRPVGDQPQHCLAFRAR